MVSRSNPSCHLNQRCARSKRHLLVLVLILSLVGLVVHYSRSSSTSTSTPLQFLDTANSGSSYNPPQDDATIHRIIHDHFAGIQAAETPSEDKRVLKDLPATNSNATLCLMCNVSSGGVVTMSPMVKEASASSSSTTLAPTTRPAQSTSTTTAPHHLEATHLLDAMKKRCSSPKRLSPGPHSNLTFLHTPGMHRICRANFLPMVVLLVHSSAERQLQRNKIRKTWASLKWSGQVVNSDTPSSTVNDAQLYRVETVFVVSQSSDPDVRRLVQEESDSHDDVLQIAHSYQLKEKTHFHLLGFHYLFQYCHEVPYVVVLPDEHFVNIPHLLLQLTTMSANFASTQASSNNTAGPLSLVHSPPQVVCNVLTKVKAIRDFHNPLHVTRSEWSRIRFPPHCDSGVPYFINRAALHSLLFCAYHQPYLWVDNVFITGVLPQLLNITLHSFWSGFSYTKMMAYHAYSLDVHDHIFLTQGALLDERTWIRIQQISLLSHVG